MQKSLEEPKTLTKQVRIIAIRFDKINKQVGTFSNTIDYVLENEGSPKILKWGMQIKYQREVKS